MALVDLEGEIVHRQKVAVVLCQMLNFYHGVTSLLCVLAAVRRRLP